MTVTPPQLLAAMTALETAAGGVTAANDSPAGRWKRIAAASETLASATSSANAGVSGYMLRTAIALESIAGTSGTEENRSYAGLLKRIVDALEALGDVGVGSLGHRFVLAAEGASFATAPPDLMDGAGSFASATGWTLAGTNPPTISAGKLTATGDGTASFTLAGSPLTAGVATYLVFTVDSISAGSLVVSVGTGVETATISSPGTYSVYLVPTDAGQDVVVSFTGSNAVVDAMTVQLPATLGADVAVDGGFDNAAGWTLTGTGGVIALSKYSVTAAAGIRRATRTIGATLVAGECYRVMWTISNRSAGVSGIEIGGTSTILTSGANGTFTLDVVTTAGTQNQAVRVSTNGAMDIDTLIIKKLTIS